MCKIPQCSLSTIAHPSHSVQLYGGTCHAAAVSRIKPSQRNGSSHVTSLCETRSVVLLCYALHAAVSPFTLTGKFDPGRYGPHATPEAATCGLLSTYFACCTGRLTELCAMCRTPTVCRYGEYPVVRRRVVSTNHRVISIKPCLCALSRR